MLLDACGATGKAPLEKRLDLAEDANSRYEAVGVIAPFHALVSEHSAYLRNQAPGKSYKNGMRGSEQSKVWNAIRGSRNSLVQCPITFGATRPLSRIGRKQLSLRGGEMEAYEIIRHFNEDPWGDGYWVNIRGIDYNTFNELLDGYHVALVDWQ